MSDDQNKEPKIIVDDDWKTQVEKEKEQLKEKSDEPAGEQPAGEQPAEQQPGNQEIPPASFMILLSTLGTQVMASLGQFPDPVDGQRRVNKPLAKHLIDTIAMLEEKTKGNLDEDEAQSIDGILHELRILFVQVKEADGAAAPLEEKKSPLELP